MTADVVPAVAVDGLTVRRGSHLVLGELSAAIPAGQVGLLGPSGSGKTTLLRAIVGVQRITAGTVRVLGEPAGSSALRHRIGYVTQAASVYDDLTVAENLRISLACSPRRARTSSECSNRPTSGRTPARSWGPCPADNVTACRSPRRCSAIPNCVAVSATSGTRVGAGVLGEVAAAR